MLVVDASALVDLLVVDPAAIAELVERVRGVDWMSAPDLIDYEILNTLWSLVARSAIDAAVADSARLALRDLRLTRFALTDELTNRMWDLRHQVTIYDASYLAVAEHLDVPLITTDRRLASGAASATSIAIEYFE